MALVLLIKFLPSFISGKDMISTFPVLLIAIFVVGVPLTIVRNNYIQHARDFKSVYKKRFVMGVLDTQLDNVDYLGNQGFSRQQIQEFQLVPLANHVKSEDYLKAVYRDVLFEQSDVVVVSRARKRQDITYFRGRMLKMPYFKKQVEGIRVFTKNFKYRADSNAVLVRVFRTVHVVGADTTGKAETEDVEFNRLFDVYSANEQEVQELLTPEFRETLKGLASGYDSVAFHFKGNELYVAIGSQKNTFDCSVDKPILYEVEEQKVIWDVNEIKKLIDALSAD